MTRFDEAIALRSVGTGRASSRPAFDWTVPPGWGQGRGAWGGLIVGALVEAVLGSDPGASGTVRSVSAEIAAPARVGDLRIETTLLRRGSALAVWNAIATGDRGEHVARLSAVLGGSRHDVPDHTDWQLSAGPATPAAAQVPVVPIEPPLGPEFGARVEFRPVAGLPVGAGRACTSGWVRLVEPVAHTDASLLALVDAWWPATLAALSGFRSMATVNFAANLMVDPSTVPADQPLLHVGAVSAAHDGFSSETRQLWTSDGRLAVENLQSIVLIS